MVASLESGKAVAMACSCTRIKFAFSLFVAAFATASLRAQDTVPRPKITGISHVAYFVSDLPKAIAFWHDFLGYEQSYTLPMPDNSGVRISFIKINDQQHIELFNEKSTIPHNFMSHLCFSVNDIEQMRSFLRAKGYDVKPGNGAKTKAGDYAFEIKDPDGMLIEFVQSLPDGLERKAAGKLLPDSRISPRVYHVGYLVGDAQRTMDFYTMLGFTETWRGGANPKELSWINLKVPDGDDYIELMLYHALPEGPFGSSNHISLMVPDIEKAVADLKARPYMASYGKELAIRTGVNQKHQMNMYDPDATRVELMEPFTITGKPTAPSMAPPPAANPPWAR